MGFLNRNAVEIGHFLDKKMQKTHFLLLKKLKNTEIAHLCLGFIYNNNNNG